MKLNVKAFALACGILWGLGLFIMTWWIILLDGPTNSVNFLGSIYRGYKLNAVGSLIGFAWAFVDGIIAGAILAALYNLFAKGKGKE